jgi:hypothetical protein
MKKVKLTEDHIEKLVIKVLEEQLKDGFNKGMHDAVKDKPNCSEILKSPTIKPNEIVGGIVKVVKGNKKVYKDQTKGVSKLDYLKDVSAFASGKDEPVDDIYYIEVNKKPFCKLR